MKVTDILASIDMKTMALPEFQRGYVWSRDQVRGLMQSLYRHYPVGSLLVWQTEADVKLKGGSQAFGPVVQLLLDGQQRITSLYGIMRGTPPKFFQGNEKAFTDLYFDLRTESFEFYGPVKMKGDPLWVSVTALFQEGLGQWFGRLTAIEGLDADTKNVYFERLGRVLEIAQIDLHVEQIVGANRTVDEVVEIFNRVNSGGTKLSKGDLTLARICAEWPEAREQMLERINVWSSAGFHFKLDWLLRVTNAIVTGSSDYATLREVTPKELEKGLATAAKSVDSLLNLVGSRLGLDHDRVLGGRYAFSVMARFVAKHKGPLSDHEQQRLLFWYIHAFLWGRYSGSTETVLQQDLDALAKGGLDGLVDSLDLWRGDLKVRPEHFAGSERGSRFYPMLYLLSRVGGAQDLCSGIELKQSLLGKMSNLELHHIFPKAQLQKRGYGRADRNALANFCFLTKDCNLHIGSREPAEYFAESLSTHPDALSTQWIPEDPDLRKFDNYPKFLEQRRMLLAKAANELLDRLRAGSESLPAAQVVPSQVQAVDEEPELSELTAFVVSIGLSEPELHFEIVDDESGEVLAQADVAWPNGLQEGLTEPVAYLAEPDEEMETRLNELGYRYFTDRSRLNQYFETLTGLDLDGDGIVGFNDTDGEDRDQKKLGDEPVPSRVPSRQIAGLSPEVVALVEEKTPADQVQFRFDYLGRCVTELGLEVRRPNPKRAYVSVYPRADGWVARVAALRPSSGRLAVNIDPATAEQFPTAAVVLNNGEPVHVKVYLTSSEAVDEAIELTQLALER